jgi:hypothetical protein
VEVVKRIRTQAERWDYVLSGNILIVVHPNDEQAIGIIQGTLFNFTLGEKSNLNLDNSLQYATSMKEEKVKKFLHIYEEFGEEKYIFCTDEEFAKLVKERSLTSYDKHEGAWNEV